MGTPNFINIHAIIVSNFNSLNCGLKPASKQPPPLLRRRMPQTIPGSNKGKTSNRHRLTKSDIRGKLHCCHLAHLIVYSGVDFVLLLTLLIKNKLGLIVLPELV